jgi:hypothetical protein
LDTGFDASHPSIRGGNERLKAARNWTNPNPNDMNDLNGRGTHSLALILRLAPEAEVFVARVATGDSGDSWPVSDAVAEVRIPIPLRIFISSLLEHDTHQDIRQFYGQSRSAMLTSLFYRLHLTRPSLKSRLLLKRHSTSMLSYTALRPTVVRTIEWVIQLRSPIW